MTGAMVVEALAATEGPATIEYTSSGIRGPEVAAGYGNRRKPRDMWSWVAHSGNPSTRRGDRMHQYRHRRVVATVALVGALLAPALSAGAQTAPDNTKTNQRDRAKGAATADQQKENASDRDITQKIRQAVMDDKSLSTYAHNVKVIAQDGQVTLKGPVRSENEKKTIEAKAVEVAGDGHVSNQITIAPSKNSKK
jgi:hyperosmotically inducible periplasmic protein